MKLWTVRGYIAELAKGEKTPAYAVITKDDNPIVIASCGSENDAKEIADDHNAWANLMQRGWWLEKLGNHWIIGSDTTSHELEDYISEKRFDTPQAAIRAADAWLKERGQ